MNKLDRLIKYVEITRPPFCNVDMLLKSLRSFDESIIGMDNVKNAVAIQVLRYLVDNRDTVTRPAISNMMLYGSPGLGKTTVAKKISDIVYYSGMIGGSKRAKAPGLDVNVLNWCGAFNPLWVSLIGIVAGLFVADELSKNGKKKIGLFTGLLIVSVSLAITLSLYLGRGDKVRPTNFVCRKGPPPTIPQTYTIVERHSVIGKYVGWSETQMVEVLEKSRNKTVIVDEAYNMLQGEKDSFGQGMMGAINTEISNHEGEIFFIFLGYKDLIKKNLIGNQPGIERRCRWKITIQDPPGDDLYNIYIKMLDGKITYGEEEKIKEFIKLKRRYFRNHGGDMDILASTSLETYADRKVCIMEDTVFVDDHGIRLKDVEEAFDILGFEESYNEQFN